MSWVQVHVRWYIEMVKSHLIDTNQLVDEIESMVRQRVTELEEAKSKEIIRTNFSE